MKKKDLILFWLENCKDFDDLIEKLKEAKLRNWNPKDFVFMCGKRQDKNKNQISLADFFNLT